MKFVHKSKILHAKLKFGQQSRENFIIDVKKN